MAGPSNPGDWKVPTYFNLGPEFTDPEALKRAQEAQAAAIEPAPAPAPSEYVVPETFKLDLENDNAFSEAGQFLSDMSRKFMSGGASAVKSMGWLEEKFGISNPMQAIADRLAGNTLGDTGLYRNQIEGQQIQDVAKDAVEYWEKPISEDFKRRAGAQLGDEDFGATTIASAVAGSAVESMLTMGAGGAAGQVTKRVGQAALQRLATEAAEGSVRAARLMKFMKYAPAGAGGVAAGSVEGVMAAGASGANTEEQILGMSHDDLLVGSQRYFDIYAAAEGMEEDKRQEYAKTTLADEAGRTVAVQVGIATAAMGAPFGAVLGHLGGKGVGRVAGEKAMTRLESSLIGQAATGFVAEATQESLQEGAQNTLENLGIRTYADKEQELTEGLATSMLVGGLVGGIMGGTLTPAVGAQARAQAKLELKAGKAPEGGPEGGAPEGDAAPGASAASSRNPILEAKINVLHQQLAQPEAGTNWAEFSKVARWASLNGGRTPLEYHAALKSLAETGVAPENVEAEIAGQYDDNGMLTQKAFEEDAKRFDFSTRAIIRPTTENLVPVLKALDEMGANPYVMDDGTLLIPQSEAGTAKLNGAVDALVLATGVQAEVLTGVTNEIATPTDNEGTAAEGAAGSTEGAEATSTAQGLNAPGTSNNMVQGLAIVETPLAGITVSKDVPQFKDGADEDGVVEPLGGTYDRRGTGPIQLWERLDGRMEVISGRHRLRLARDSGETTIPSQVYREADGFTAEQAAVLDAELNIRDGQGKVKDYVQYFQSGITEEEADARGLLARATGKRAYTIATEGSAELIAAHSADRVTDEAAVQIAQAAPKVDRLQNLGMKLVQDGKSIGLAVNTMRAVQTLAGQDKPSTSSDADMFGFDDGAMKEAEQMATVAGRKQAELRTRISAISGASKRPELAKSEGINIKDPKALNARIKQLRADAIAWDSWHTSPAMVEQIRAELAGRVNEAPPRFSVAAAAPVKPSVKAVAEEPAPYRARVAEEIDFGNMTNDEIAAAYESVIDWEGNQASDGGAIIDTDLFREIDQRYRGDRSLAPNVHEAASTAARMYYMRRLAAPVREGKQPSVLFTGGGGGSGKGFAIKHLFGENNENDITLDTTLSSENSAFRNIEMALASGRMANIIWVYRSVEKSAEGAIRRAAQVGRPVPVSVLADAHSGSAAVIEKIRERYADDPRVTITRLWNDGTIEDIHEFDEADPTPVVDARVARTTIFSKLEAINAEGSLPAKLYRAFASGEIQSVPVRGDSESTGGQDQAGRLTRADGTVVVPAGDTGGLDQAAQRLNNDASARQLKAGNYRKGRAVLAGVTPALNLPINVVGVPGSFKQSKPGEPKYRRQRSNYEGELRGTVSADGMPVDVIMGKNSHDAGLPAFVVHQMDPRTGKFDEPKVVTGYATVGEAKSAYLSEYPRKLHDKLFGGITQLSRKQLLDWIASGETHVPPHPMSKKPMFSLAAGPAPSGPTTGVAFKRWFGDSKVVDAAGKPLVVYHGTTADFDTFAAAQSRSGHPSAGLGFFFSESARLSSMFNRDMDGAAPFAGPLQQPFAAGANTMPVFVAINNPKVIEASEFKDLFVDRSTYKLRSPEQFMQLRAQWQSEGYDGVQINAQPSKSPGTEEYEARQWIAFEPTQIKSATGNSGAFDGTNPSIVAESTPDMFGNDHTTRDLFARDPYANQKPGQRPDDTPEARAIGREAFREFVKAHGGTVLGDALAHDFVAGKKAELIGKVVRGPADLSIIADVYRNPLFETLRYIFTDADGKVVHETAWSARMVASAPVWEDNMSAMLIGQQLADIGEAHGATKVWMMHNHPSGNAEASGADLNVTKLLNASLEKDGRLELAGHVVMNHEYFSSINRAGNSHLTKIQQGGHVNFRGAPATEHQVLGMRVVSPEQAATAATQIAKDAAGQPGLITVTSSGEVGALTTLPFDLLKGLGARAYLGKVGAETGGIWHFLVIPHSSITGETLDHLNSLADSGLLQDVVDPTTGASMRMTGALKGAGPGWTMGRYISEQGQRVYDAGYNGKAKRSKSTYRVKNGKVGEPGVRFAVAESAPTAPTVNVPTAPPRFWVMPGLYSAMYEAVQTDRAAPKKPATIKQWDEWMTGAQRRGLFRKSEADFVDLLGSARAAKNLDPNRKIDPADVLDHIQAAYPEIKTTVLSETNDFEVGGQLKEAEEELLDELMQDFEYDADFEVSELDVYTADGRQFESHAEAERWARDRHDDEDGEFDPDEAVHVTTSYRVVFDGDSGWREDSDLFEDADAAFEYGNERINEDRNEAEEARRDDLREDLDPDDVRERAGLSEDAEPHYRTWTMPGGENYREILHHLSDSGYTSGHFENLGEDLLMHSRVTDRMTPDGQKILFIEELQSDLAQDMRDDNMVSVAGSREVGPEVADVKIKPVLFDNWQEVMFKGLLQEAIQTGKDAIAWTTGFQQAARYQAGLSRAVDTLTWEPVTPPTADDKALTDPESYSIEEHEVRSYLTSAENPADGKRRWWMDESGKMVAPVKVKPVSEGRDADQVLEEFWKERDEMMAKGPVNRREYTIAAPEYAKEALRGTFTPEIKFRTREMAQIVVDRLVASAKNRYENLEATTEMYSGQMFASLKGQRKGRYTLDKNGVSTEVIDGEPRTARDLFGSTIADQIMANPGTAQEFSSEQVIGGKGQVVQYDMNMVKIAEKLVKRLGGQVIKSDAGELKSEHTPGGTTVWRVDITPQMKEVLGKAMPAYSLASPPPGTEFRPGLYSQFPSAQQNDADSIAAGLGVTYYGAAGQPIDSLSRDPVTAIGNAGAVSAYTVDLAAVETMTAAEFNELAKLPDMAMANRLHELRMRSRTAIHVPELGLVQVLDASAVSELPTASPTASLADMKAGVNKLADAIKVVGDVVGRLRGRPPVQVIADESGLTDSRREEIKSLGLDGMVEGFFDQVTGEVYLIANNVQPRKGETYADAVERVIAEEVLGHYGLRAMFGEKAMNQLFDGVWRDFKNDPRMESIVAQYSGAYGNPHTDVDAARAMADEFLAKHNHRTEPSLFSMLVDWLRQQLRGMGVVRSYTDNDLINLMERVFDGVRTGRIPNSPVKMDQAHLSVDLDGNATTRIRDGKGERVTVEDGDTRHITAEKFTASLTDGWEQAQAALEVHSFAGDIGALARFAAEEGKKRIVAPIGIVSEAAARKAGLHPEVVEGAMVLIVPDEAPAAARPQFSLRARTKGSASVEAILEKTIQPQTSDMSWAQRANKTAREVLGYFGSGDTWTELRAGWIDSATAIEQLERGQFGGALLDAAESAYKFISLTKNLPQLMSAVVKYGVPQYKNGSFVRVAGRKGLSEIYAPLYAKGQNLSYLYEGYAVARRSSQLIKQQNPDGTSKEKLLAQTEIDELIALEKQYPEFASVFDEWQAFNRQLLDLAVDRGAMSKETADLWKQNDYVPFFRVNEDEEKVGGMSRKRGLSGQSVASKRLTGSDQRIQPVIQNTLMNTAAVLETVYKNEAMNRIVALADGVAMTKLPMRMEAVKISNADIARQLMKAGFFVGDDTNTTYAQRRAGKLLRDNNINTAIRAVEAMTQAQRDAWTTFFRPTAPVGNSVVSVMVAGKPVYYDVTDPLVFRAIADMTPTSYGGLIGIMGGAKHLLTNMVTADPGFMIANYLRDLGSSFVTVNENINPFANIPANMAAIIREDGLVADLAMAGGMTGGYFNTDEDFAKAQRRLRGNATVLDTPRKVWEGYRKVGQLSEQMNRLTIARAVLKRGGSLAEAAYQAQDVLNFTQSGDAVAAQLLMRTVPFLNARIQGLYRLYKGMRGYDSRDPKKAMALFFMKYFGLMILSGLLALKNAGDERYESLPDDQKDTYWHIFAGDHHLAIPKPFEVGVLAATIPERFVRLISGLDNGKTFTSSMARAIGDTLAFNPIPQAIKPMVEQWANKSFFTGSAVVGMDLDDLDPVAQYNPWTSETARGVATLMDQVIPDSMHKVPGVETLRSPVRIEHAVRAYLGTMGAYALQLADSAVGATGMLPGGEAPSVGRFRDVPVLGRAGGRFWRGNPELETRSKYADDLYASLKEADSTYRTVNAYMNRGEFEKADALWEKKQNELSIRKALHVFKKQASSINKAQRSVMMDESMTGDEKRAALDDLTREKNALMKEAVPYLAIYNGMEEDGE